MSQLPGNSRLSKPKYIYESPDGGATVYRRLLGETEKELVKKRFEVATYFDCTKTGVNRHRRSVELSEDEWHFKRNQQRNFDTLIQLISLRSTPTNISGPYKFTDEKSGHIKWVISFETDNEDVFIKGNDKFGGLLEDCSGVPMITGLDETNKDLFFTPYLITSGEQANIIFA